MSKKLKEFIICRYKLSEMQKFFRKKKNNCSGNGDIPQSRAPQNTTANSH
jgi:hypothetical protein